MSSVPLTRTRPVLADLAPNVAARDTALVVAGALIVALSAQLYVVLPFTPVPITGQTFGVLLVGAGLGARRGALAMVLYLAIGAIGLPVYTEASGGVEVLRGATAGYLVAFPIAAAIAGAASRRGWDRTPLGAAGAFALGSAVIYLLGAGWLATGVGMGLPAAVASGVVPFVIGDVVKAALAGALLPGTWALVRRVRGSEDSSDQR